MAASVPVRLSAALTTRARAAAQVLDRSLTEQVEHWARLGQVVESAIQSATTQRLKARSYDATLAHRLAVADTAAGRTKALELIKARNAIRHGLADDGTPVAIDQRGKRAKSAKSR